MADDQETEIHIVKAPDGKTYKVKTPKGTDQIKAFQYVKENLMAPPAPEPEPDLAHNLKVAGSTVLEGLPRAVGTALGTLGGGAVGSFVTPVAGTIAGGIGGGIAGGAGAEKLADLATRYFTGNPEATYRGTMQSKFGTQPTSEGERLAQTMIGAGLDVGSSLGVGSLVKGAGTAAIRRAGQMMAAQPVAQLAAGEAGAATTEMTDNKAAGLGSSLIPAAYAAVKGRLQFPKAAVAKTLDEWKQIADTSYDNLKNAGVVLKASTVNNLSNKLTKILSKEGYNPRIHSAITPIVETIQDKVAKGKIDFNEINGLGQDINYQINLALKQGRNKEATYLGKISDGLEDFVDQMKHTDFDAGNSKMSFVRDSWKNAKSAYAKVSQMRIVDDILKKAEDEKDPGLISKGFKRIAGNTRQMDRFSGEERKAVRDLAKGKLDAIGTLAPDFSISGRSMAKNAAILASNYFLPGIMPFVTGAGIAAKAASRFTKPGEAKALSELISRGYKPGTFDYGAAMAPSAMAGAREAMQPELPDSYIDENGVPHITIRKAVGGLASLKKRYG